MSESFTSSSWARPRPNRLLRFCFSASIASLLLMTSCKDKSAEENPDPTSVSKATDTYSSEIATKWVDLELKLIKTTPGYTPPVAARALGYTGLTLYETVVPGIKNNQSLVGQISGLNTLPKADLTKEYNWGLAANAAMSSLVKELFITTSDANKTTVDSLRKAFEASLKVNMSQEVIDRSIRFGADIATAIFEYSKTDGGHEAYSNNFPSSYIVPRGIGFWVPTGPQRIPLLPYWGNVRSFVAKNATTDPPAPTPFSYKIDSEFFKQAKAVYDAKKSLTTEQKNIALFWADGGGTVTPPGHYMNIATQVLRKESAKLDKVAETYAKMGIALSDAFVACWRCKYRYNLMRPVTYIKETIDPSWTPFIATPPFPEYSSGHSSGSGAFSQIMTNLFGENYAFTDKTHEGTFANRSYKSFFEAAEEAMNSRLYGGIHYPMGNQNGRDNGKKIGQNVSALKFTK
ncbi:MAG: vanadium-dependent haloperoxidase [Spirosomaceae bacterium]|nr:vanadium-dependent haloperoxidase [Spirosomataceae bacterium]